MSNEKFSIKENHIVICNISTNVSVVSVIFPAYRIFKSYSVVPFSLFRGEREEKEGIKERKKERNKERNKERDKQDQGEELRRRFQSSVS